MHYEKKTQQQRISWNLNQRTIFTLESDLIPPGRKDGAAPHVERSPEGGRGNI